MTMAQATQYYSDMQEVLTNRGKALQSGTLQQAKFSANISFSCNAVVYCPSENSTSFSS